VAAGSVNTKRGASQGVFFRLLMVILLCLAITIAVVTKIANEAKGKVFNSFTDYIVPSLELLAQPSKFFDAIRFTAENVTNMQKERDKIEEDRAALAKLREERAQLETENIWLRGMMNYPVDTNATKSWTARVVGTAAGFHYRSIIINVGDKQEVSEGLIVRAPEGLVGVIVGVGHSTSRVLLITDSSSRVPIIMEKSRERAIMTGTNSALPTLNYLRSDSRPQEGERVLTSGDGKIFPSDIPIGIVKRGTNNNMQVVPFVNWDTVEYVTLLDYRSDLPPEGGVPKKPKKQKK
jgi:rod shape-determining protein MreC